MPGRRKKSLIMLLLQVPSRPKKDKKTPRNAEVFFFILIINYLSMKSYRP